MGFNSAFKGLITLYYILKARSPIPTAFLQFQYHMKAKMHNVISNIHVLGECSAVSPVCPSEGIRNQRSTAGMYIEYSVHGTARR